MALCSVMNQVEVNDMCLIACEVDGRIFVFIVLDVGQGCWCYGGQGQGMISMSCYLI